MYKHNSVKGWEWFENILVYDNAIIPLALYRAAEITNDGDLLKIAEESTEFLERVTLGKGYFKPIGSRGWYPKGGVRAEFAQQAVETMGMTLLLFEAYRVTGNHKYLEQMFITFMWFLGKNELGLPVYDYETGGCADGLEEYGLNRNQGAESAIAYLISHLTLMRAFEFEHEYEK